MGINDMIEILIAEQKRNSKLIKNVEFGLSYSEYRGKARYKALCENGRKITEAIEALRGGK